jgi:hypothetical protein
MKMTAVPTRHDDISSELLQVHQTLLGHGSELHDLVIPFAPEVQHASVCDGPSCRQITARLQAVRQDRNH